MNDWIKCSKKMPPVGIVVLLYQTYPPNTKFNLRADPLQRNFTNVGGLRYDGKFVLNEDQHSELGLKHVSHWRSLPEPPND